MADNELAMISEKLAALMGAVKEVLNDDLASHWKTGPLGTKLFKLKHALRDVEEAVNAGRKALEDRP